MLHSAVALDAAMTARSALRRLARHGYWLDPDAEEAREFLQEYVERMRELVRERRRRMEGQPRAGRPSRVPRPEPVRRAWQLLDPAELSVESAVALLARPPEEGRAAIRRQDGITIFWYARPVDAVLRELSQVAGDTPLGVALDLHEYQSDRTVQADALEPGARPRFKSVVLNGEEVFGVIEPEAAAEGSRRLSREVRVGNRDRGLEADDGGHAAATGADTPAEVRGYPFVDAPERVTVLQEMLVTIGLSEQSVAGVATTGPMVLRAGPGEATIVVDLQVVADGFDAPQGWVHRLEVAVRHPTVARVVVPLIPRAQDEPVRLTSIVVLYVVDGVVRGSAARHVVVETVAGAAPPPDPRGSSWLDTQPPPAALGLAVGAATPDVEVNIARPDGSLTKGRYSCTLRNAHGVPAPVEPLVIELGNDAATFGKVIIDQFRQWSGDDLVDNLVDSLGAIIAAKLPAEFWSMLRDVAAIVTDRSLTLQVNSAEPYVPWELALVDPPLEAGRPRILAAQTVMGRWILGNSAIPAPPRREVAVSSLALMAGMYNASSGLRSLPKAEEEVADLEAAFRAMPAYRLQATSQALKTLLDGTLGNGVQVVHFAGHGEVDPRHPGEAAIFLSNGKALTPLFFRKSKLGKEHAPFIFFNACMVGAGGELLGEQDGFPGNCLSGGFSALVAPLWAVNDEVAKTLAIEFYREALSGSPRPVAEVLRNLRSEYRSDEPVASLLAYVYYGNPFLTLRNVSASAGAAAPTQPLPGG